MITAALVLDCLLLTSSRVLCPFIIFNGNTMFLSLILRGKLLFPHVQELN